MIAIITIIFGWFLFIKIIKGTIRRGQERREAKAAAALQREIDRIAKLEAEGNAEQERMRQELLQVQMEQIRAAKEAERIAKEQERQAREQAKQATILLKHEQRIANLEYRMQRAEADIEHWKETVGNLYALRDVAMNELEQAINGGKNQTKYQKQIITLDNQIHSAETRLAKAKYTKAKAEQESQAA